MLNLVYLAGPINGCTDDEAVSWRELAKAQIGMDCCLDPMRRDYRGREGEFTAEIVEADKADIFACGLVLANCWQQSTGTSMEVFYAHSIGKPVIAVVPPGAPVSPWLKYHATVRDSLGEAINEVLRVAEKAGA